MEKKVIFGTLAATVTSIVLATIIFQFILGKQVEAWSQDNAACLKEMNPVWWIVGSFLQSLLMSLLLYKLGVKTFRTGAITAAWITFLLALLMGIYFGSTFIAYSWDWLPIDVISNTVIGCVAGGVIGWVFGKVNA